VLQDFQNISLFPITAADVLTNMVFALICGLALSLIYRATYRGPSYSVSYVNSLVMLTVISALVILVIGNNLARAFGLVGAMSIIRFRTAVRDTMDMVFIFLSLALGMACGVGLSVVALLGTAVSGIIIIALTYTHFGAARRRYHLLQITYDGLHTNAQDMERHFGKYCRSIKLVNVKNTGYEQEMESLYHVALKRDNLSESLVRDLNQSKGVRQVNVFFDEDDVNPPTL
jgi:ABC-type multidrug transport system fused ATPase/permease subunit